MNISSLPTTEPAVTDCPTDLRHVAIIMDGNNRFEKREALSGGGGHAAGKDQLDPIVEHARRIGIEVLTVFAFSSENWNRTPREVALLMQLFEEAIVQQIPRMKAHDIALRFIGDRSKLSVRIQDLMAEAEQITAHFKAMTLVIAISYGGMWDMAEAAKQVAMDVIAGTYTVDDINEQRLSAHVAMADLPPVDLLIRTGGEYRLSNFVLWQAAYAELYFTETLWPDFSTAEFDRAVAAYTQRQRRFGGSNPIMLT